MRPGQVQIDFGPPPDHTPRTSSDFEEISYPTQSTPPQPHVSHSQNQESLPLHYMSEDTSARRRVPKGPGSSGGFMSGNDYDGDTQNDNKGKDVYSKLCPGVGGHVSSGRIHRPYLPPLTSIVFDLSLV